MTDINLYRTFEQDTKNFINQINDSLMKLENNGYSAEVINHIFRCIHSIKSEAAYLGFDEISSAAHQMESAIEPLRNVGTEVEVDPVLLEFCFTTIDKIGELAAAEPVSVKKAEEADAVLEEVLLQGAESGKAGGDELPYSGFELMLLKEARLRGERLYVLSFGIAEDEDMKYPRAYLALSNLEQHANVIKSSPEVEQIDQFESGRLTVVLTSLKNEAAIAALVNIDQIVNIEISELSYENELMNLPTVVPAVREAPEAVRERVISVEANEIDAISAYVGEIKKRLADLSSAVGGSVNDRLSYDLAGIETISNSIEKMMTNLQTVDFNVHFSGFRRTVRDLSARLGKKTELFFDDENIRLPRDLADFLAEPMLQIIRNAVVHGIEPPKDRLAAGKSESGIIRVRVTEQNKTVEVIISDDGRGIDEDAVRAAASAENSDDELLDIISRPGYTSLSESGPFAGRGVGLDLVRNRISRRGARLELTNAGGLGCEFRIIISEESGSESVNYLVVGSDEGVCAVELEGDSGVLGVHTEQIECSGNGCFYKGLQLFSLSGRLRRKPADENGVMQAVKLQHLGKTALLLFSESLFEIAHKKEAVEIGESVGKYTRKLKVNGIEADYLLLNPELIFD